MKNKLLYMFMSLMLCYFNLKSLAQVSVSVNWGATQGKTSTGKSFGINCNRFFEPAVTNNPTYLANLQFMNPKFVRFHDWAVNGWEIPGEKGWMDANEEWNMAKVIQALTPFKNNFPNMDIIMNICQWPTKFMIDPSFNANGYFARFTNARLRTDKYDAFADWCASLLTICKNNGFNVKYWELPNELEDLYPPTNTASNNAICEIYRRVTNKLKQTDPTIKTGGLSFTNSDGAVEFLSQVANQSFLLNGQTFYYVDFYAEHNYPAGAGSGLGEVCNGHLITDQTIYDQTKTYIGAAQGMSDRANTFATSHYVEKYLDEFAVSYNDHDIAHSAYTAAVYYALAYFEGLLNGVDGMHDWNDFNNGFGLQDESYNMRPRAYTLHMLTNHMIGTLVNTSSSNNGVVLYAVKNGNARAVLLINRTVSAQNVAINFSGWGTTPSTLNTKRIRPSGVALEATYETSTVAYSTLTSSYALPANSVTTVYVTESGGG